MKYFLGTSMWGKKRLLPVFECPIKVEGSHKKSTIFSLKVKLKAWIVCRSCPLQYWNSSEIPPPGFKEWTTLYSNRLPNRFTKLLCVLKLGLKLANVDEIFYTWPHLTSTNAQTKLESNLKGVIRRCSIARLTVRGSNNTVLRWGSSNSEIAESVTWHCMEIARHAPFWDFRSNLPKVPINTE